MATPGTTDFVISQGDTLPLMRVVIPANSANQLIDLSGATVNFLGRIYGSRTYPPPIVIPMESYQQETEDGASVIAVYIHFREADTAGTKIPAASDYVQMQGELEIVDGAEVLTVPSLGYITWFIRDDIGDA